MNFKMKKKYRRAAYNVIFFVTLPFAAFTYWMSLISEDIEHFQDWLERKFRVTDYDPD